MRRVIVPPAPGLVSAFGSVIADERVDRRSTVVRRLDRPEAEDIATELGKLAEAVATELAGQRRDDAAAMTITTHVACRYLGQNYEQEVRMYYGHVDKTFELAIQIAPDAPDFVRRLGEQFHAVHREAYGYDLPDQAIQSVYLGATAVVTGGAVRAQPYTPAAEARSGVTRRVLVGPGTWADAAILRRADLTPGTTLVGPAIIEEGDSTTYVPPDFRATVDPTYCLILQVERDWSDAR
jgi:N-methylhydantoinase A